MSLSPGDLVKVSETFFVTNRRMYIGLRPTYEITVHDESSPGLASQNDIMTVLAIVDVTPYRALTCIYHNDIHVLHPSGFTGYIYENILERVQ